MLTAKGAVMKRLILVGLFLFLGIFALSAQSLPSVRIVNNTGYTIFSIFVSPSELDEWGENILGDSSLVNGSTFTYRLPYPLSRYSVYDVGMENENEAVYIKWDVKVANNIQIIFTVDDLAMIDD